MKNLTIIVIAVLLSSILPVSAQGLIGQQPDCLRWASLPGPDLPGKTADERWQFLLKQMPHLMGLSHQEVINLFQGSKYGKSWDIDEYCIDDSVDVELNFHKGLLNKITIMKLGTTDSYKP